MRALFIFLLGQSLEHFLFRCWDDERGDYLFEIVSFTVNLL